MLSPAASNSALALGQGHGGAALLAVALALAALQAVAVGVLLWSAPGRWRWAGPGVTGMLLGALGTGTAWSVPAGLLAVAGVSHALLYAGLLWAFGRTLLPGRTSLVTGLARRLNPRFHSGMVPYTRGVTAAWCLFFAGQLVASAVLLAVAPGAWRVLVGGLHPVLVLGMAAAEYAVRCRRWRHEHHTGWRDTVAGVRRMGRDGFGGGATGGGTSRRA